MPPLSNPKHELYCQELAKGRSAIEAYEAAGYSPDRGAASRLSANVSVQSRLAELQERAAERAVATRADVLAELHSIGFAALGDTHVRTADKRNALKDIAEMEGWIVRKVEQGAPGDFARMEDAELEAEIARLNGGSKVLTASSKTAGRG